MVSLFARAGHVDKIYRSECGRSTDSETPVTSRPIMKRAAKPRGDAGHISLLPDLSYRSTTQKGPV
jgi:hypothetical protein